MTRTLFSHSSAHMLMPTSPRPPSGRYLSRDAIRGPREVAAKPLTSWGCSQQVQLLGFLLGWRRRWWWRWRRQELVEVGLDSIEVGLEVGDQRAVVESGGRVVER